MSLSLDDVDVDLMWQVSLPFSVWWSCGMLAVAIRLSHRDFDISLASIRAQVGIMEINYEIKKTLSTDETKKTNSSESFSLFENVDFFVLKATQFIGFGISTCLYCYRRNRDKREHRRTSMVLGELFLQIQPFVVMLLWGITVLSIKGGILFGLLLLFVGEPMILLLWLTCAWRETGFNYQSVVSRQLKLFLNLTSFLLFLEYDFLT